MVKPRNSSDSGPYIKPKRIHLISDLVRYVGIIWAVASLAFLINAMTETHGFVEFDVIPTEQSNEDLEQRLTVNNQDKPTTVFLRSELGELQIAVERSTMTEQILSRAHYLIIGLAALAGSLLLRPVLLSISEGVPFLAGNAKRLRALALVIVSTALLVPVPPILAADLALDRIGWVGGDAPFVPALYELPLAAIATGLAILVVAEAFRHGSRIADDVEGLI